MIEKIQWICEACDSSNSVEAGQPAVCRFCRLTYDVKIGAAEGVPEGDPASPAVAAAVDLLSFEPEQEGESSKSKREK
jgi:hypothetical protein